MRQNEPNIFLIALPIIFMVFIVAVILVAALFLTNIVGVGRGSVLPSPAPKPQPATPLVTPEMLGLTSYHNTALGFALDYPPDWRKQENTLDVVFSPSAKGLDPMSLQDAAVWIGIPPANTLDHGDILRGVLVKFPKVQVLNQDKLDLSGTSWTTVNFSAQSDKLMSQGLAAAGAKNEVGYYIIVVAPAKQWTTMQPTLQQIIHNFRFTEEAVLRPTDATPPPTPTPTPTPVVYVVQPGDTLLGIALEFGIDADTLAARNGIEKPELLQTGQELIIPLNR